MEDSFPIAGGSPFSPLALPDQYPDYWENPDPEAIDPYEGSAVSNYPGGSNILYIPSDLYYTRKALAESIKRGDSEEIIDTSTRLFGIPANVVSTGGTIISYGKDLGIITHLPCYLAPITIIAGLILCVVEGLVDIFSLARQKSFESKFDFDLLSHLRNMIVDVKPEKAKNAVKKITSMVNTDSSTFESIVGKDQAQIIKNLLNEIHGKVEKNPEFVCMIMEHYRPALEEVAKQLLVQNLEKIKDRYLLVNGKEIESIEKSVALKNPGLGKPELLALQKKELEAASTIKKKQLARRVRPWMVNESIKTIAPLLEGIISEEPEAIHEGLKFIDDMHTQSKKKKIAHVLGVIALVFAAASLIAMAVLCPPTIPYILAGVAMTFALTRAGIYAGTLESRGWTFEPKKMVPMAIRKRIFSNPGPIAPPIRHKYQREMIPDQQREWIELFHKQQLDLQKRGFESFHKERMIDAPIFMRQLFV